MLSTQRQSERACSTIDAGASVGAIGIDGAADADVASASNGAAVNIEKSVALFIAISLCLPRMEAARERWHAAIGSGALAGIGVSY